jgi:hypothetical protein
MAEIINENSSVAPVGNKSVYPLLAIAIVGILVICGVLFSGLVVYTIYKGQNVVERPTYPIESSEEFDYSYEIAGIISEFPYTTLNGEQKEVVVYESTELDSNQRALYKIAMTDSPITVRSALVVLLTSSDVAFYPSYRIQISPLKNYIFITTDDYSPEQLPLCYLFDESGEPIEQGELGKIIFTQAFHSVSSISMKNTYVDYWIDSDTYQLRASNGVETYLNTIEIPSLQVGSVEKITENGIVLKETALKLVQRYPAVIQFMRNVHGAIIEVDSESSDAYRIHVYEIKDGHTATQGWYAVIKASGQIIEEVSED